MRPDYEDTEWRKANGYDYEPDGPPWWAALIGALIMLAIPAILVVCIIG